MNLKPYARYLYANVPGAAAARFGVKDLAADWFAKPEYSGVRNLPIEGGLIVDVGANRGQSIAAFRRLAPRSIIVAFEPEPRSASRLAERHARDRTIEVHPYALGKEPGEVTFFVPSYGLWDCDGMSASSREAATEWLEDPGRMYRFDKAKLSVVEHTVECRTLDSFEFSPSLIKLHAQGAELDILQGSRKTLERHRPALMCAFVTRGVADFLSNLGYRPYVYRAGGFHPGTTRPPITFTWYLTDDHTDHVHRAA
jgi:FkbM family methyltransferase